MARLKIKDAPLLTDIQGDEKIPTGMRGDYTVTPDMLSNYIQNKLPFVTKPELAQVEYELEQQIETVQTTLSSSVTNLSGRVDSVESNMVGFTQDLNLHKSDTNNPHVVTKQQIGLGSVDNTSDINKPLSNPTKNYVDTTINSVKKGYNLDYFLAGTTYPKHAEIMLSNGVVVQSLIDDNTNNPNSDMTGWKSANSAENLSSSVYIPNKGGSVGAIGGTFRGYSGGVQFIEDTAHKPFGTTGISKADNYTVRLEHNGSFGKVGALTFTADESFSAMGVMAGASVAQNFSLTKVIAPLYFTCKGDGTITKVSPLFEGSVTLNASSNPSGGILRFDHPLKSVTAHQALICNRGFIDNVSKPMEVNVFNNDGGTYTQIQAYTEQTNSVWVKYNTTTAQFEAVQGINRALFSFTFNSATGVLSIGHQTVRSGAYLTQPNITAYQTANRFSVNAINATTTSIICYDSKGEIVKEPTADYSFFFTIQPATRDLVLSSIPANNEFEVFVGNCYVPVDNLQKVPSGNIWFYGAMNK